MPLILDVRYWAKKKLIPKHLREGVMTRAVSKGEELVTVAGQFNFAPLSPSPPSVAVTNTA